MATSPPDPGKTTLGVVLAGGQSRRFGSDKAFADVGGIPLIERAVYAARDWCGDVVIVGRDLGPAHCIPDWPEPHRGPLGGIAGALRYAAREGFEAIMTIPVDAMDLPESLPELLGEGPVVAAGAPTIAHWPVSAFDQVRAVLEGNGKHSLRELVELTAAREVKLPRPVPNINRPTDLKKLGRKLK